MHLADKINFSKFRPYGLEHIKIELVNQDKYNGHIFPFKYLESILVTLFLITSIGKKTSEGIIKNSISGTE